MVAVALCAPYTAVGQLSRDIGKVYSESCAGCHGTNLEGGRGGALIGPLRHGTDDASIARIIREGAHETGMPAFGAALSEAEVQALVVYIREQAAKAPVPGNRDLNPMEIHSSEREVFRIEPIVESGLQVPWSFTFLPESRILLTERAGRLRIIDHGRLDPRPVDGVPTVIERGEGGLMSVVLHPDYEHNGWIYLSFSDPGPDDTAMTKIIRGRLQDHRLVDIETIFSIPKEKYQKGYVLFGCRLVFQGDYLFFSVGERGVIGDAQRIEMPNGKIHRVFADGRVPPDNPFIEVPGAFASIWSYGHRNPQGLALDANGELWETEHGPRGGDELNRIERGKNYGWPLITYGINYEGTPISEKTEAPKMEQPVRHWTPSIATSQIAFYPGDAFPEWKNRLFLGSLAAQRLILLEIEGGKVAHEEDIFTGYGRVRDIHTGPDGLIYVALEQIGSASGRLVRLVPVSPATTGRGDLGK